MDDLRAGQIVGRRYRLVRLVGKGGMAEVWSAHDEVSGHAAAIKLVNLDTEHAPHSRARFQREAELSSQLRGPNFVEVYSHGMAGDRAFLAMELLDGESLADRLKREVKMSRTDTLTLLKAVASGLRVAHSLQVVHRDLKPANVYFARIQPGRSGVQSLDGRREIVKLLDFGVAKDAWDDARITQPGTLIGSAHYMSPEQVRSGRDVDVRADLWSLAVILFRALTGERPFSGSMGEVLAKIVNDEPKSASTFDTSLRGPVDRFFDRALMKDPAKRFQTVDELLEAFTHAIEQPREEECAVLRAIDALDTPWPDRRLASDDEIKVSFDSDGDNRATIVPDARKSDGGLPPAAALALARLSQSPRIDARPSTMPKIIKTRTIPARVAVDPEPKRFSLALTIGVVSFVALLVVVIASALRPGFWSAMVAFASRLTN